MNKLEKRIIGSYYKNYRKRKNLTIKEVSVLTHLSHAAISEFENGKTKPSQETIRHIIKCYGIEFDLSADYIIEREAKLNKLVELYCLHDFDSFVQWVDKIRENIKYRDSYFYPLFLLCEYYHAISSETESNMNNDEIIMLTGEIGNCYDSFFENEKLLYAIFKYQHECKNSEKKAYQHLRQIYFEHSASQSMLVSVIKYLLSYSEDINKNYYEEIRLLEQAAHTFVMNGYISRSLFCFNNLSLVYSNVFDYEKSVNAAEKAMRIAGQINNLEMLNGMYNNLSIIYHQMEDYKKAKEYATIVKDIPLFSLSAYSILVVANMRFGDIQEAKSAMEVLEKMNQKENSEHYGHFIRVNKAKLYNKKGPHYYSALKAYLHYAKDNLPISRSIRIYEDMIDYCRENSMYDELIAYHEKINECYKLIKK